jgi:hypothetical protein
LTIVEYAVFIGNNQFGGGKMPYIQRIDGREYILSAVVHLSREDVDGSFFGITREGARHCYLLTGAEVYSRKGVHMGFWSVAEMPEYLPGRLKGYFLRELFANTPTQNLKSTDFLNNE